jgi:hypothetical protein
MKTINKILNYFIIIYVMVVLGYSAITNKPVLEITEFDSQWWILFMVTMLWAKAEFKNDDK